MAEQSKEKSLKDSAKELTDQLAKAQTQLQNLVKEADNLNGLEKTFQRCV